jgi:hypothetical protein|tara:strand:- start:78 stop:260 length:183 start_codon:yes stop_codon:yes gene_type:complete
MEKMMVLHNLLIGFAVGVIALGFINWVGTDEQTLGECIFHMVVASVIGGGVVFLGWHFFY